jgi:hypothetical protein
VLSRREARLVDGDSEDRLDDHSLVTRWLMISVLSGWALALLIWLFWFIQGDAGVRTLGFVALATSIGTGQGYFVWRPLVRSIIRSRRKNAPPWV